MDNLLFSERRGSNHHSHVYSQYGEKKIKYNVAVTLTVNEITVSEAC